MNNLALEWLIILTDKYEESRKFYSEILGFEIVREVSEEEFCQFKLGNIFLAIYGRKEMEKLVGKKYLGKPGTTIFTFKESDDIDKQYEDLKGKGVEFIVSPKTQTWGQRTAYFVDPDGYIWEIQQWIERVEKQI